MSPSQETPKVGRPRYDPTFRRHAVELWHVSKKSSAAIAAELGIKPKLLYAWRDRLKPKVAPEAGAAALPSNAEALALENAALRRELAHLREQRDILTKTLGILSEAQGKAIHGLKP